MASTCDSPSTKVFNVIYSSLIGCAFCLALCLLVAPSDSNAAGFSVMKPYIPRGSYANHHPPYPYSPMGGIYHTPVVFPPPLPFFNHGVPFVNGPQLNGWPFDNTLINGGGLGAEIDVPVYKSNGTDSSSESEESDMSAVSGGSSAPYGSAVLVGTGVSTGGGSSQQCCPTCGVLYRSGLFYTRGYFPSSRVPVNIYPWSTSQYNPLRISTEERGSPNSPDYQIYFRNDDGPISPFHDIPLYANEGNKIFNMVVEVPRWTNAKMEIATKDPLNPIKQDVKKGKLRYVANVFPHHGYIWNYGALPQTWEDPGHSDDATGCKGDNDPIDVCEIGYRVAKRGEVIQVKVLGTLAMIDEGETDWKLIAIDVNDPLAPQLSDISDVEKHMPGFLKATVEWFKVYKIPDGKPENQFAFDGMAKDREFAHKIIMDTHEAWQNLVDGTADAGGLDNTCVAIPNAANKMTPEEAEAVVSDAPEPGPAATVDPKVDTWHYVTLK